MRLVLLAAVWCASCAGAFWYGRRGVATAEQAAASAAQKARQAAGKGFVINNVIDNKNVPSLQDLLRTKGRPDPNALRAWADSLDPSQCASLLADLQKMPDGNPRDALIAAMINAWATKDPQGYLKDYASVGNPRARESGVSNALRAMATKDPQAALAWLKQSTDVLSNQELDRRYRSAIQGMATNDPQAALDYVKGLNPTDPLNQRIQMQGINAIANQMARAGNFDQAAQMFDSLPANLRGNADSALMFQWAQSNPADATTYIAGVKDPTERTQLAAQAVRSWSLNDPAAAAQWAQQYDQSASTDPNQPTGQLLADAVRSWSRSDLNSTAQFLNTLKPSPETDQAIAAFATQAGSVDPSSAMNWAGQINDPNTRQQVAGMVTLQWLASDPSQASQIMANSTLLSPQQKQRLGNLANNPQLLNRIAQRFMGGGFGGFGGGGGGGGFGGGFRGGPGGG